MEESRQVKVRVRSALNGSLLVELDVNTDMTVNEFGSVVKAGNPMLPIKLIYNDDILAPTQTLSEAGFQDVDEVLALFPTPAALFISGLPRVRASSVGHLHLCSVIEKLPIIHDCCTGAPYMPLDDVTGNTLGVAIVWFGDDSTSSKAAMDKLHGTSLVLPLRPSHQGALLSSPVTYKLFVADAHCIDEMCAERPWLAVAKFKSHVDTWMEDELARLLQDRNSTVEVTVAMCSGKARSFPGLSLSMQLCKFLVNVKESFDLNTRTGITVRLCLSGRVFSFEDGQKSLRVLGIKDGDVFSCVIGECGSGWPGKA